MTDLNRERLHELFTAIQNIISEKTNREYAQVALSTIFQKLQRNFSFLKYVTIEESGVHIGYEINEIPNKELSKAVESIIRILYLDLKEDAGLFFLNELEVRIRPGILNELRKCGTDIDLLKIEHHLLNRNLNRVKIELNQNHPSDEVDNLDDDIQQDKDFVFELEEIEKDFLHLLQTPEITYENVIHQLHISDENLTTIVSRLIHFHLIQYVSNDEIELTNKGLQYIQNKRNIINNY